MAASIGGTLPVTPEGSADPAPRVVVVGAASRDLASDDPRGWRLGGGVTYATLALARLGLRVGAVIGVDTEAASARELDLLRAAGAVLAPVPLATGPVFENLERPGGRIQHALAVSGAIPTDALPAAWRSARAWLLNPVAGEVHPGWASVPPTDATVALGWQGLLRHLEVGGQVRRVEPARSPLLARASLVGVSADDLDPGTSLDALAALLAPGATLLLTRGEHGGVAVEVGADGRPLRRRTWPAIPAARTVDPTGAGDLLLAGVFAARVEPRLVAGRLATGWELRLGAAAASLVCEAPGLDGVPERAAVSRRMAEARVPR